MKSTTDSVDLLPSLCRYFKQQGWERKHSHSIDTGIDIVVFERQDSDNTRLSVMSIQSPIKKVSKKHLKYILKKSKINGIDNISIVSNIQISNEIRSLAKENNVKILSAEELTDSTTVSESTATQKEDMESGGEFKNENQSVTENEDSREVQLPDSKAYELKQVAELDRKFWMLFSIYPPISAVALYKCNKKGLAIANFLTGNFFIIIGFFVTPVLVWITIKDVRNELDSHNIDYNPNTRGSKIMLGFYIIMFAIFILSALL